MTERICLNCQRWQGDREKQRAIVRERGEAAMTEETGWPEVGRCRELELRLDLEVSCSMYCYGGTAVVETPAWFGCVLFRKIGK